MKAPMYAVFIFLGTLFLLLGLVCFVFRYYDHRYELVRSDDGRYSFYDWNNKISPLDFSTYDDAFQAARENKVWSDRYDNPTPKASEEVEAGLKRETERASKFKPLKSK